LYASDEQVVPREVDLIARKIMERVMREAEEGNPDAIMIVADCLMEACQENRRLRELLEFGT
jgi:hypothetical protein